MKNDYDSNPKSGNSKPKKIKKEAHPSFHSDSKKYGIKSRDTAHKETNVKEAAHPNFHSESKKYKKR
ncbi:MULTISPECIES: hypothetical protein [Legionella]|uniref:Uncharacterized protein n=1 Tax=Legionella maceachernii TaxID=466 RepID=A0A0W0VY45_9GAMM|nr:hypothetical protein [Legionella maceachernii]KTD24866.1 hypothetical protein Lmac_2403 [Legionella maceachernii]SKA15644.1 hypothetical protein SAMN02745128_02309 [Legionella maceachernii]SUP01529.1 Uncharacterised protein [Legionella maceachernii]